jgi:hypothetical protein
MTYYGRVEHHDIEFDFEAYFRKGRAGNYYDSPEPDEFEIVSLTIFDKEVADILSAESYSYIEDMIFDIVKDEAEG